MKYAFNCIGTTAGVGVGTTVAIGVGVGVAVGAGAGETKDGSGAGVLDGFLVNFWISFGLFRV